MTRNCDQCGSSYETNRPSRYCGAACRKRKSRGAQPVKAPPVDKRAARKALPAKPKRRPPATPRGLVAATRAELRAAGKLGTALGQQAVRLAQQMSGNETAAGMAALSKELRTVMSELLSAKPPAGGVTGVAVVDKVDELRARRDRKLAAG